MGRFIDVEISAAELSAELAERIVSACPVDIFRVDGDGRLVTIPEHEDECILCARCVDLAPAGVAVRRRYGVVRALTAKRGGDV